MAQREGYTKSDALDKLERVIMELLERVEKSLVKIEADIKKPPEN